MILLEGKEDALETDRVSDVVVIDEEMKGRIVHGGESIMPRRKAAKEWPPFWHLSRSRNQALMPEIFTSIWC